MVVTTLAVTFALTVGLAAVVLLSVAAPTMRRRGSKVIVRIDSWTERALPVVRSYRDRAQRQIADRLEAHHRATQDEGTARAR